jgi:hypothetical protein
MPRPQRPQFNSAVVPVTLSYLWAHGVDADALARKHLPPAGTDPTRVTLSTAAFRRLMSDASKAAGDPLLGLHIAIAMPRGAYGLIEFALRSAPTGRAALDQLARFGPLINPAARFWVEPMDGCVALHHRLPTEPGGVGPHGNLFTVGRLVVMAREMMGEAMKPGRVWLAHPSRACPPELVTFFGTDRIEFGKTSNGLTFDDAWLDRPLEGADPALNAVLREHAGRLMSQVAPRAPRSAPGRPWRPSCPRASPRSAAQPSACTCRSGPCSAGSPRRA